MRIVTLLLSVAVIGCLPRPSPASPQASATAATQAPAPEVERSPASDTSESRTQLGQAPMAPQPYPQPYPQPAPQPYPQPAPQPPPNGAPAPQPPATYGPPSQTYPPVQPYAAPQPYPAPASGDPAFRHSHTGNGEVIVDLAAIGALAAIDLLVRQDATDGSAGAFLFFAGLAGGGAAGWLLTEAYPADAGAAHATSLGLLVGTANGALLIQPTRWDDRDQVLGLLLLGGAAGTAGGFVYGQAAELTSGQATFIGNLALLGSATAAFAAVSGSRDGKFGGWEDGTLALGLDAGVLGGALIAPRVDWSPRRSKVVLASTAIGALVGGVVSSLITSSRNSDSANGDLVAGCMTGGMWGGFGLGILTTQGAEPDGRFSRPTGGSTVTVAPFAGDRGQLGMMAAGSW
jgi:hypothetical protein